MARHTDDKAVWPPFIDQCRNRDVVDTIAAISYNAEGTGGAGNVLANRDADTPQAEVEGENGPGRRQIRRGQNPMTSSRYRYRAYGPPNPSDRRTVYRIPVLASQER